MFVTSCPTRGLWYRRFQTGARARIGQDRRQDFGLSKEVVAALLEDAEMSYLKAASEGEKESICEWVCYMLATYSGGLRGEEVPLISLKGMLEHWDSGRQHRLPHVMTALKGRFKGETGDRWHLQPLVAVSSSGISTILRRRVESLTSEQTPTSTPWTSGAVT